MDAIPIGFVVRWDEQDYRAIATQPHVRVDGNPTTLIDWQSDCPRCADAFVFRTGMTFRKPRRFCDACKAPGLKVRDMRKKLRRQISGEAA